MFQLSEPSDASLRELVSRRGDEPLAYEAVGSIERGELPPGFVADDSEAAIGRGPADFEAAREALEAWCSFDLGWVRSLSLGEGPPREGVTVAVVTRTLGLWAANLSRVVRVEDERRADGSRLHGFTYATLAAHAECGEERFRLELRPDGEVRYRITAHSRPAHWLAWLGLPYARFCQGRFRRESIARLTRAVKEAQSMRSESGKEYQGTRSPEARE